MALSFSTIDAQTPSETPSSSPSDLLSLAASLVPAPADPSAVLPAPAQDQGLPYTRSAWKTALAKVKRYTAVFVGSRYAYVKGYKVRLDPAQLRSGEAGIVDGKVMVPAAFGVVLQQKEVYSTPAPDYLADRWVYNLSLPPSTTPTQSNQYIDLVETAKKMGLQVYQDNRGLVVIGTDPFSFSDSEKTLEDSVITLFDTPEKFADPDIATRYIPWLTAQGKMIEHVNVTPDQWATLNGPETKWPTAPASSYDFTGFNKGLLGSAIPSPGVYPRLLFSEADLPMLMDRLQKSQTGQRSLIEMGYLFNKTWWDPSTSDGAILVKLDRGDTADLKFNIKADQVEYSPDNSFVGEDPGIFSSKIQYVPECLTTMALYCLLTHDDLHGKWAADALYNYYKMREPLLDEADSVSDSEAGSSFKNKDGTVINLIGGSDATHWRMVAQVIAHMNLGLALDFGGKWMSDDEKDGMRRIIANSCYGRRSYGQNGPVRFRDVGWVGRDLTHFLANESIEGLEGFDPEVEEAGFETVRSFCDWGIDDDGVVNESNGKTAGGLQFVLLSMITSARHGHNFFGHPHLRKLATGQIQMTSPSGAVTVNSGTQELSSGRSPISFQLIDELKSFFPDDRRYDYLLGRANLFGGSQDEIYREWLFDGFDPAKFKDEVGKLVHLRLPSPSYPGLVRGVVFDSDFLPTTRADLNLPLDFVAPIKGVYSGYSDRTPQATWMNMLVRPDEYLGAGDHHPDAGMFHFSSEGVDWISQGGKSFDLVQVDGKSEPEAYNAAAKFLGASSGEQASAASADLTYAYSYAWLTSQQAWTVESQDQGWELEPSPEVMKIFAGTARCKLREGEAGFTSSNYLATCRSKFNPMQYVYRTVGLVRGKHPYGFVVDDVKKDDKTHDYQWNATLSGGITWAQIPTLKSNETVLGYRNDPPIGPPKAAITPQPGDPLLLVCALTPTGCVFNVTSDERLTLNASANSAAFKVLLIPYKFGDSIPSVTCDTATSKAMVSWTDQKDEVNFTVGDDHRSTVEIERDGRSILKQ